MKRIFRIESLRDRLGPFHSSDTADGTYRKLSTLMSRIDPPEIKMSYTERVCWFTERGWLEVGRECERKLAELKPGKFVTKTASLVGEPLFQDEYQVVLPERVSSERKAETRFNRVAKFGSLSWDNMLETILF